MCIKFNWSVNNFAISESSSSQKVRSILGLSNIKTVCGMSNFKTQEIVELELGHGRECPSSIEECAEEQHSESIVEQTDTGSLDKQHRKFLDE